MAKALVVVRLLHRDLACQVEDPKLTPTPDVLLERRGHGLLLRAVLPGTAGSFDESVVKGQVRSDGRSPSLHIGLHIMASAPRRINPRNPHPRERD